MAPRDSKGDRAKSYCSNCSHSYEINDLNHGGHCNAHNGISSCCARAVSNHDAKIEIVNADIIYLVTVWALPVIIVITFHEAAHGFVAHLLGDDTAWRLGRVTFNPLKH